MSRWLARTSLLVLGVSVLVGSLLVPIHPLAPTSRAESSLTACFHIDTPIVTGQGWAIPPDCANWHELWPAYCNLHHQSKYNDNDHNGVVSVCDDIQICGGGECWHIDKVTTTYFFSPVTGGGQHAGEPSGTHPGEDPTCDNWHIIHADGPPFTHCQSVHIDGWEDTNGNGVLDVCDNIQIGGIWYHIDRIGCDVWVSWNQATKAKPGTWGWLKSLFRK